MNTEPYVDVTKIKEDPDAETEYEVLDMDIKVDVTVDVVDSDANEIVKDHLQTSTAVLHDILGGGTATEDGQACPHCTKSYKTPGTLRAHIALKHPPHAVAIKCYHCCKLYPSLMSLQKHVKYKHMYENRCNSCYKSFMSTEMLEDHKMHCVKVESPCSVCCKVYGSRVALQNHMHYMHPEQSSSASLRCEWCRRAFRSSRGLANHLVAIHSGARATAASPPARSRQRLPSQYLCGACMQGFNTANELIEHVNQVPH